MSTSPSPLGSPEARRLRIEEIKEKRRRFHKETAQRWILDQQFERPQPPPHSSFVNAFEFFSKSTQQFSPQCRSPPPPPPSSSPPPPPLPIDPIVIISGEPSRRRPSSILKKRDSTSNDTDSPNSVSFAAIEEPEASGNSKCVEDSTPYRRRSRSYSGSTSGNPAFTRRNSEDPSFFNTASSTSRGILKHSVSSLSVEDRTSSVTDSEFKSILKHRRCSLGSNIHTAHEQTSETRAGRSILKRKTSTTSSFPDVRVSKTLSYDSVCYEPDPKPILKKKSSSEEISDSDYNSTSITPPPPSQQQPQTPRPILKKPAQSSESIPIHVEGEAIKPCLKKPCKSFDESVLSHESIMRKASPHICEVKKCEEPTNAVLPPSNLVFKRRDSEPLNMNDSSSSSTPTSPSSGISSPSCSSSSPKKSAISQKIAALQISGETTWKKRLQNTQEQESPRASTLANRLKELESSQESWKARVSEKDAKHFTVQGKLERAGKNAQDPETSPVSRSSKKSNSFKNPFRGIRGSKTDESIMRSSENVRILSYAVKDADSPKNNTFQRSKSMRYGRVSGSNSPASQGSSNCTPETPRYFTQPQSQSSQHVTVPVPKSDNETFTSFFSTNSGGSADVCVFEDESFNSIIRGEQLLGSKRKIKVARKERGVKNPVKALAERINEQSYTDVNPEIRERENIRRRIQMENATSTAHAHLSIEALAGLATKLDYTSVKLRRAQQVLNAQYPYPILIRIKGKRFVQTRLAAPEITSLNSGDNYILVTQTKVYHFIGEYSNRMERSKSLDIVAHIVQKKEFGCNIHTTVITLNQESSGGSNWNSFFEAIGATENHSVPDDLELLGDEADEAYEVSVISTNKVWRVVDEEEVSISPIREYWGIVPKYKLLESSEVLIFDFGPEMYVWSGSKANVEKKKLGYRVAEQMFEMQELGKEFDDVRGAKSKWRGWLRKVNQHMEPIVFIEKFFDWPEDIGRIRVGANTNNAKKSSTSAKDTVSSNFVPSDGASLKYGIEAAGEVTLVLEGFDVKRGRMHVDEKERRNYTITTTKLNAWSISEFSKSDVPECQVGHFTSAGTYVIRWQYTINFVGKDLKGNTSKHNSSAGGGGRDRCAYFFWHGKRSKITEQGTSALMTVELDDMEEQHGVSSSRGPQIRVEQNYEPPAFLSLFKGKMFIHDNQVNTENFNVKNKNARLYVTLGADEEEGHFMEVACSSSSFRSNGAFLLFDESHRVLFLWIGAACPSYLKKIAQAGAAHALKNQNWTPTVTKLVTVKQSHETDSFWSCILGEKDCIGRWCSLIAQVSNVECFKFTVVSGKFEVIPIVSPRRNPATNEPFPIVQDDLYGPNVSQPSLFLIQSPDGTVYLWQGWRRALKREFVVEDDTQEQAVDSTPLTTMWHAYRRCSIESSLNYARAKNAQTAVVVFAGLEPPEFTHIFGYWDHAHPSVREAHDYHINEGKSLHERVDLQELFEHLTSKRTYTVEELIKKPEGVDLMRLEDYLSDDDFERLFHIPRSQFEMLQAWRKTELKKSAGLF